MNNQLRVSLGQYSDRGRKSANQDCHGASIPREPQLTLKGAAVALADGISSSEVSHVASETAVKSFLDDYFCTSEAWSVKTSGSRVLGAVNAWLNAQSCQSGFRFDRDRGYVCTLSAVVVKGGTAHIFHVGDSRVYRVRGGALEQLTNDHRLWVAQDESYLSRALGFEAHLEPDYQALPVSPGDIFLLATDGVYDYADASFILQQLAEPEADLDTAARAIADRAFEQGSPDNLTVQLLRIDALPGQGAAALRQQLEELPLPPLLEPRAEFDGYTIIREIHASGRSHAYLAHDRDSGDRVVIKTPSIDLAGDAAYLERFFVEEWIARRINSRHVLRAAPPGRARSYLYTATEYIDGQTLSQWLLDHPRPDLETVRGIIEQVARGLRAFHRMEMLHQDLKPDNVMIDAEGTVKIIDFGATRVAGLVEAAGGAEPGYPLGTALYTAPEYFLGETGTPRSDLFSLGVLTYFMLSGRFPYGTDVARARTAAAQRRLVYRPVLDEDSAVPAWVDAAIQKAVHPNPLKRYDELSEFLYDLRNPSQAFLSRARPPLIERNPVAFWQGVALIQGLLIAVLLVRLAPFL